MGTTAVRRKHKMKQGKPKQRAKPSTNVRNSGKRHPFPHLKIARMWAQGKSIAVIAHSINRMNSKNLKDPYHALRNCLRLMHMGYRNSQGKLVKLPYRVSQKRVRASRIAGFRAAQ
jgi:hypothetical protein